jgi:hypothetical protein
MTSGGSLSWTVEFNCDGFGVGKSDRFREETAGRLGLTDQTKSATAAEFPRAAERKRESEEQTPDS